MVFFRPDHNDYISKSRNLIKGREHYTPGAVVFNVSELLAELDKAAHAIKDKSSDSYQSARDKLCGELFDHRDGRSAERICELIERRLNVIVS